MNLNRNVGLLIFLFLKAGGGLGPGFDVGLVLMTSLRGCEHFLSPG